MRFALALLLLNLLGGCAWLLGHAEPPQPRSPARPLPATARFAEGPLTLDATFLGVGERVVTARNLWGRAGRVVNAYGEDTFVVAVTARAAGEAIMLQPTRAVLRDDGGKAVPARTLADFRARWPGWAVASDEEEADRLAAYGHVLDTLLIDREVPQDRPTTGRLAFPAWSARRKLVLTLPYQAGHAAKAATLVWEGL